MSPVRRHLSFENVLVTVVAFVVLAGGTAFAAGHLAKNSVGKKQLKANAVTTAKIKKNAVTRAKIRAGAVDGSKVKDGSLTNFDLDSAAVPFGRLVHEAHSIGSISVGSSSEPVTIPLDNGGYTQEAGRDDSIVGAVDVTFDPSCGPQRVAIVYVLIDGNTADAGLSEGIVALGEYVDEGTGSVTARVNIGPIGPAGALQPATATNHSLSLASSGTCKTGSGISISNATVGVLGVKK